MEPRHLSLEELNAGLDRVSESPLDGGRVEMLVVRPVEDARITPGQVEVSAELGVHGDHWSSGKYREIPDIQIAIINSRLLDLVSGSRDRWPLAGDNIVADLDLSPANLAPGQKLEVGSPTCPTRGARSSLLASAPMPFVSSTWDEARTSASGGSMPGWCSRARLPSGTVSTSCDRRA
jgi:hypothetical protein